MEWTEEQKQEFIETYFLTVSKESNLMSGFIGVYNLLKKQGHEFIVITARGGFVEEMKEDAIRLLPIDHNNSYEKIIDSIPQLVETFKGMFEKNEN